jgi:hypothetical protein
LKKCTTPTKKERERTSFQFLSLFPMPPKQKVTKQSSKALLKRVGTEQMSSAKAGSLLERAQDAAETERAEALLKVTAGSTARVADGRLMKASSGLEDEETTPKKANDRSAFSQSDRDIIGESRYGFN